MRRPIGSLVVLGAALAYTGWLGSQWLPLGLPEHELSAFLSRAWDIRSELAQGRLPWWTPHYLSGSSYGLHHVQGLYLVPWLLLSLLVDLHRAGKLTVLAALCASGPAMHLCARHVLRHEGAAVLAALAYLFYPQPLVRAAESGHVTVVLIYPLVPLVWLALFRTLEQGGVRVVVPGAVAAVLMLWAHNKQALAQFLFMGIYTLYFVVSRRERRWGALRSAVQLGGLTLLLGACLIVPGLREASLAKLFAGEPMAGWQRTYAVHGPLALVDRGGVLSGLLRQEALEALSRQDALQAHATRLLLLQAPGHGKYVGLVLLVLAASAGRAGAPQLALFCAGLVLASGRSLGAATWDTAAAIWAIAPPARGVGLLAAGLVPLLLLALAGWRALERRWLLVPLGVAALLVPAFPLLSALPLLSDIRAPEVFFDLPSAFFLALLSGHGVRNLLARPGWCHRAPPVVAVLAALLLLDAWPYQRAFAQGQASPRTLRSLADTYTALRDDKAWGRIYVRSRRYFHLLGPMYSGRGLVNEAFYDWMSPRGTGLLRQAGRHTAQAHRQMLDLVGARYVVFDRSGPAPLGGPGPAQPEWLAYYRRSLPVIREDEDFVVFRNPTAWPFVSAFAGAVLAPAGVKPEDALALSSQGVPVVRAAGLGVTRAVALPLQGPPPAVPRVPIEGLTVERPAHGQLRLRLTLPQPALLVLSESFFPHWRATVSGQPTAVLEACGGLLSLEVPAGTHEVLLRYQVPRAYGVAALLSLTSLCAALALWVRAGRTSR
ncbi:MAG: hypothetical protein RMK29_14455 [Myxococcales bacterium]|nr:YfhO family protein [Myxococcota bacterium]MDW8282913.1 hypothetical protein [Myxococcales bacterium]